MMREATKWGVTSNGTKRYSKLNYLTKEYLNTPSIPKLIEKPMTFLDKLL